MQPADNDLPDTSLQMPQVEGMFHFGEETDDDTGLLELTPGARYEATKERLAKDRPGSMAVPSTPEEQMQMFQRAQAIAYPLGDPAYLVFLYEHSSALRQCIDAYAKNIDGCGQELEPVVELGDEEYDDEMDDAAEKIRDALWLRKVSEAGDGNTAPMPTDAEVVAERKRMRVEMRLEKLRIEAFLENAAFDRSFTALRMETRQDLELLGNAYWEVERDEAENIVGLNLIPAFTMRLMPLDKEARATKRRRRRGIDIVDENVQAHRSRRFVQVVNEQTVYFKEFGDERVISRRHGKYYDTDEQLKAVEADDEPGAEIIHFSIHSPRSPYGIPRWIGTMLNLIGLREEEETNRDYWENKSVPPLAIVCSGTRLNDDQVRRTEDGLRNRIKGRQNFHKPFVIQAPPVFGPDGRPARASIELHPLADAQLKEAIFLKYDERTTDKTGFCFRLPRLLTGNTLDFNRATSEAALAFTELQVFQPERQAFDDFINRVLFTAMGFRYWRFVSHGPMPKDSAAVAELVVKMSTTGAVTFNDLRAASHDVFNKPLPPIEEPWADLPVAVVLKSPAWQEFLPGSAEVAPVGGEAAGAAGAAPAGSKPGEAGSPAPGEGEEEAAPAGEEAEIASAVKALMKARRQASTREAQAAEAEFFAGQ